MAIGTAAALIGGSLIGAGAGAYSANRAADAQSDASSAAIGSQERMLERMLGITAPQRQLGYGAVNELSRLFGYGGTPQQSGGAGGGRQFAGGRTLRGGAYGGMGPRMLGGQSSPPRGPQGLANFRASPDYQFRKEQGMEGIAQTLGAGGQGAFSGNALRGLNEFNSNLASGEFGNYVNRRLALAGLGQNANFQAGDAMQSAGANIGNALMNQGNARASGILGAGSAINSGMNGILQAMVLQNAGLA